MPNELFCNYVRDISYMLYLSQCYRLKVLSIEMGLAESTWLRLIGSYSATSYSNRQ
jgi:hypothetical protein